MTQSDMNSRNNVMKFIKQLEPKNCDKNSKEYELMLAIENFCFVTADLMNICDTNKLIVELITRTMFTIDVDIRHSYNSKNKCIMTSSQILCFFISTFIDLLDTN